MPPRRRLGSRCAPRMAACPSECLHRILVEEFRSERLFEEIRAENERDFTPTLTFRDWLKANRGRNTER